MFKVNPYTKLDQNVFRLYRLSSFQKENFGCKLSGLKMVFIQNRYLCRIKQKFNNHQIYFTERKEGKKIDYLILFQ